MITPLTLDSARRDDGKHVLIAAGEIDMSNVDAFSHRLAAAIKESEGSGTTLTVDLSAVRYLDSSAISTLVKRSDCIDIIAHPHLMDVLTVSGVTELINIEPSL